MKTKANTWYTLKETLLIITIILSGCSDSNKPTIDKPLESIPNEQISTSTKAPKEENKLTVEDQKQLTAFQNKWAKQQISDLEGYFSSYEITPSGINFLLSKGASEMGSSEVTENYRQQMLSSYSNKVYASGMKTPSISINVVTSSAIKKQLQDYKTLGLTPVGTVSTKAGLKLYTIAEGKAIYDGEIASYDPITDKATLNLSQGGRKIISGTKMDEDYFVKITPTQSSQSIYKYYPAAQFLSEGNKLYFGASTKKTLMVL